MSRFTLTADEVTTIKTENVAYTKTADVFGTGKANHTVLTTEPGHKLRKTTTYERNGQQAWTMTGEYVVVGPRGAVYVTMRYSANTDRLRLVKVADWTSVSFDQDTVVKDRR